MKPRAGWLRWLRRGLEAFTAAVEWQARPPVHRCHRCDHEPVEPGAPRCPRCGRTLGWLPVDG
jgi:hypothetical protein